MNFFRRVKLLFRRNLLRIAVKFFLVVALTVILYVYHVNTLDIFLVVYIVVAILFRLDSRVAVAIGLVFLALVPTYRIIRGFALNPWDDRMALYAYYFLAFGILLQTVEFFRRAKKRNKESIKGIK